MSYFVKPGFAALQGIIGYSWAVLSELAQLPIPRLIRFLVDSSVFLITQIRSQLRHHHHLDLTGTQDGLCRRKEMQSRHGVTASYKQAHFISAYRYSFSVCDKLVLKCNRLVRMRQLDQPWLYFSTLCGWKPREPNYWLVAWSLLLTKATTCLNNVDLFDTYNFLFTTNLNIYIGRLNGICFPLATVHQSQESSTQWRSQ